MRGSGICVFTSFVLACFACGPATKGKTSEGEQSSRASAQADLKGMLEGKVRAEWAAFKNRDRNAYGDLLAEDFVAVEDDGQGTRNKSAAAREVEQGLVTDYSLAFFKCTPLGPDSAFVTYEASIRFPPKAQVRFERVYVSEVWVKRDGQWKTLHYQDTRVK